MKTACVYHSIDLDGWMSAAIVKHWFNLNSKAPVIHNINGPVIDVAEESGNDLYMLGYNYGQPVPDLSGFDRVVMCDISFPRQTMDRLWETHNKDFIWIDHHISAIELNQKMFTGSRSTNFAACELTWMYFFKDEKMPELVRLLGRYDCFGHKGTSEEKLVLEFQYGARQVITNYEEAFELLVLTDCDWKPSAHTMHILNAGSVIYKYLCMEAKQSYKNGFEVIFENPSIDYSSRTDIKLHPKYKFILVNKERFNPINFDIDYHADGYDGAGCFHFANGKWNFSLYNDNGLVDCSQIAKTFGGGGHKGAAGFTTNDLSSIHKDL